MCEKSKRQLLVIKYLAALPVKGRNESVEPSWLRNLTKQLQECEDPAGPSGECTALLEILDTFTKYYIPALILLGLVGNLLSCLVFLSTHLRLRSSSYYLAALATADFGFLLSLLVVWISDNTGIQVFNKEGWCQGLVYTSSVCSFLSVWLIVAFTVERFIAVQYPLHRPHMCTIQRAKTIIFSLLVFALISQSYSFFTAGMIKVGRSANIGGGGGGPGGGEDIEICEMREEYAETMRIINLADSLLTLLLPLILIVFMNCMIMRNLIEFNKRFRPGPSSLTSSLQSTSRHALDFNLQRLHRGSSIQARTDSSNSSSQQPQPAVAASSSSQQQQSAADSASRVRSPPLNILRLFSGPPHGTTLTTRAQQNITKMLLVISTVFIILNLPSYVVRLYAFIFYSLWRKKAPVIVWCIQQLVMLFYYTNFSVNFLLYSMYGVTFRKCLWQMLKNKFPHIKCHARSD